MAARHYAGVMIETPEEPRAPTRANDLERRRAKLRNAGFAFGIGSAAIVAALLYASTVKKPPRNGA